MGTLYFFCTFALSIVDAMNLQGKIVASLLLFLSLVSCREGRRQFFGLSAEEQERVCLNLSLADSLMEENPDSALAILRRDSADVSKCDKHTRMLFGMLKTHADDKKYITHRSDSVIREATEYFLQHGDARQQAQAGFLFGRVSYDLHHTSSAMLAWKNVLTMDTKDSVVCRYKARAVLWLGSIYDKEKMYRKMLACGWLGYKYAVKSDYAKIQVVEALRYIGCSWSYLKDNKKAIGYYQQALKLANETQGKKNYDQIVKELAAIYIEEGMLREAGAILLHPDMISLPKSASYYYTTGKYYEAMGEIDSAVVYYHKNIALASVYSKTLTIAHLVDLYDRMGNYAEADRYRDLGKIYEDSLTMQEQTELQDYEQNVEENLDVQKENEALVNDKIFIILSSCLLCVVLIALSFFIVRKYKRNGDYLTREQKRMTAYWQQLHNQDIDKMKHSQEEITKLQNDLTSQKRQMAKQLSSVGMPAVKREYEDMDLVNELNKSTIYTSFNDVKYQPSKEDYDQLKRVLDRVYDHFTGRLKFYYSALTDKEMNVCCLLKIGVPIKIIGSYLGYSPSAMSRMRSRLYEKFTGEKGKPTDFDSFISKI